MEAGVLPKHDLDQTLEVNLLAEIIDKLEFKKTLSVQNANMLFACTSS